MIECVGKDKKSKKMYLMNNFTFFQILLYLDAYKEKTDNPEIQKHLETLINSLRRA